MESEPYTKNAPHGPLILRIALGLLFIIPGLSKLANPGMVIGMLRDLGFPAAGLMGWILLLAEITFGAAVLAGYKVRMTIWPLAVIMVVAGVTVAAPQIGSNPMAVPMTLFHLVTLAGLVSLYFTGPGAHSVSK